MYLHFDEKGNNFCMSKSESEPGALNSVLITKEIELEFANSIEGSLYFYRDGNVIVDIEYSDTIDI